MYDVQNTHTHKASPVNILDSVGAITSYFPG